MKTEQTHRHGDSKAGVRWGSLQIPQPISSASSLSSARREGLTCLWGAVLGCKHPEEGTQLLVFVQVDQSADYRKSFSEHLSLGHMGNGNSVNCFMGPRQCRTQHGHGRVKIHIYSGLHSFGLPQLFFIESLCAPTVQFPN